VSDVKLTDEEHAQVARASEEHRHPATCPRDGYEQDVVEASRKNHIWLNAFSCIYPSDEFCRDLGRQIIDLLSHRESTIPSEYQLTGNERCLVVRINKS